MSEWRRARRLGTRRAGLIGPGAMTARHGRVPRCSIPVLIAVLTAIMPAGALSAQARGDLYQATVIVTGTDMRSRPLGFERALRAVLVTVSGEPRLRKDPRVAVYTAQAGGFVTSFSYVDRMAGRPVHDEQGTRDRPYNLTVHFDPVKIDKALATLSEHPWRGPRPVVVPVLAVRGFGPSYLLSAESPRAVEQRTAFADVARGYGLSVRFPTNVDLAGWGATPERFPAPAAASSSEQAVVAGVLEFREALPGWVGSWKLRWHGTDYAWSIRGVNYDTAFRDLVEGVVRVASGHGAPD